MISARTLKQGLKGVFFVCFVCLFVCLFCLFVVVVVVPFVCVLLVVFDCFLFYPKTHFEDVYRRLWHVWLVLSHISSKLFETSLICNTKTCYFPLKHDFILGMHRNKSYRTIKKPTSLDFLFFFDFFLGGEGFPFFPL